MMKVKPIVFLSVGILFLALAAAGCSSYGKPTTAEQYPVKPITVIVPYAAGGTADVMARAIEKSAAKRLGQPLVVVNMPGGAATIGWNELAGSKPDGYTIGYAATACLLQPLYNQTRYHYPSALEPLAQVMSTPLSVAVAADQPWQSIDELIRYAAQHPGELKFGHSGLGSGTHIAGEIFAKQANVNILQVPFRGEGETIPALLGGHIQITFINAALLKDYHKSGKVRILAVTSEKRINDPVLQNIPTLKEQGQDIALPIWHGLAAPKGLPPHVKAKLTEVLKETMNDPEFIKNMADLGMTVEYLGPKEFSDKWISDNATLTKMVKDTGIVELIASQKN